MFPFCENSNQDQLEKWVSWGFSRYHIERNLKNKKNKNLRKCSRVEGNICEIFKNYNCPFPFQLAFLPASSMEELAQWMRWLRTQQWERVKGLRRGPEQSGQWQGGCKKVVNSKDSSVIGRSTYSELFLIE